MTLRDLWDRLLRQWRLILGVTAVVVLAVAAWTFLSPERYRSTAALRVLEKESSVDLLGDIGSGSLPGLDLGSFGENDLATEIGVLRSRRVHEAVVDSLALRVRVSRPAGARTRLLRVEAAGPPELEGEVRLHGGEDDGYRVEVKEIEGYEGPVEAPERVRPGEPFRIGPVVLELLPVRPGDDRPGEIRIEILPRYAAIEALREDVRIERQEGGSRLIEVSYDHTDRHLAAAVVNGIVAEYLDYKRNVERGETRSRADELRREVDEYATRLLGAEEELREFQQRNQVLAPEAEAEQQVRRVGELQVAVDRLRVERTAVADVLRLVEQRSEGERGPSAFRQLATLPSLISNGAIENMLQTLVELENERSTLMLRRRPENEDVRQLGERISELEGQLHRVASSYLESLDQQLASTGSELNRLMTELEAMPGLEMEYLRRLRDRVVLEESYVLLRGQLSQAEVQEAIHDAGVRVVDAGEVPHADDPVFPKPGVNLLLALLLGLTMGTGGALARDLWDDRVHTRADVRAVLPGSEVIAVLPALGRGARWGGNGRVREVPTRRDPWSPAAEAYRGLATSLSLGNGAEPPGVLVVTSPRPGDGKTTVAVNLAVAFAQQGLRTLLVDGDVRGGGVAGALGVDGSRGLAQVLSGRASPADVVQGVEMDGSAGTLHVLPSGEPRDRPLDLGSLDLLDRVLVSLRKEYDRVVVDSPSVERGGDALALGRRADAVMLVVRQGRTERLSLERASERIRAASGRAPLLVVNAAAGRDFLRT